MYSYVTYLRTSAAFSPCCQVTCYWQLTVFQYKAQLSRKIKGETQTQTGDSFHISKMFFQYLFFPISETPCVKFYRPERGAGELLRLCRGDECTCAEGKQDDVYLMT